MHPVRIISPNSRGRKVAALITSDGIKPLALLRSNAFKLRGNKRVLDAVKRPFVLSPVEGRTLLIGRKKHPSTGSGCTE
jgi:hypothetical protein